VDGAAVLDGIVVGVVDVTGVLVLDDDETLGIDSTVTTAGVVPIDTGASLTLASPEPHAAQPAPRSTTNRTDPTRPIRRRFSRPTHAD
jgi:hypothetical protein